MKADTPERSLSPAASALAAGICVLWGANTVAIKFSLEGFGPFTAAAVRFGISLALLWAWAAASGRSLRPPAGCMRPLVVNSILFHRCTVEKGVTVNLTIADKGVSIGTNARVGPAFEEPQDATAALAHYPITLLGKECRVAPGAHVEPGSEIHPEAVRT